MEQSKSVLTIQVQASQLTVLSMLRLRHQMLIFLITQKKLIGTWKIETQYPGETERTYEGTMTFTTSGTYLGMFISDPETGILEPDNGTWSIKSNNILNLTYSTYSNLPIEAGKESEVIVSQETDEYKITKLTDKEFVFEFVDEDGINYVFGSK